MLIRFKPKTIIDRNRILQRIKVDINSPNYDNICKAFNNQISIIESTVKFESIYLVKKNINNFGIEDIDKCERIAYCFTSIGKDIVNIIDDYFQKNEYLEGYLVNEIVDELVMSSSRQMYRSLKNLVKKDSYNLTKRYSPGEGELDIKFQKTVIKEIKKEIKINASLTENYMIVPEKSTLFIYGIDKNIPETFIDHDCSQCKRKDCQYRE